MPDAVGDYGIIESLGAGGMGEVFLAYDRKLSRKIALKRVRRDRISDAEVRKRFEIEARVTAMLQHPSIIPVYQYSKSSPDTFYTMRPVEGMSLSDLLKRLRNGGSGTRDAWTTGRLVRLFLQAANAIAFAHSRGVIHRDLKPANIMIGPFEEVLVLDWGMAKVLGSDEEDMPPEAVEPLAELTANTASRALIGTPAYMAPEQLRNVPAGFRTDIFALGVILYELLALRAPWEADNILDLRHAMENPPELPTRLQPGRGIPSRLAEVALKALEHDPGERFQSVAGFSNAVAHALEGRASWEPVERSDDPGAWKMAHGRIKKEPDELVLRSRGPDRKFRYFFTERFTDNVKLEFEFSLRRGRNELSVWINAANPRHETSNKGYCLSVVPGKRRMLSLLRSGRDVAGARGHSYEPRRWYKAVAAREDGRVSLSIDGEEVYVYSDPIPLAGGFVGLSGVSNGLRVRGIQIRSLGAGAMVSCLSVPDAFFNRELYEDARDEYDRIAASHPGREEGRLGGFRAGLCLLEMARQEADPEVRQVLLDDAYELYANIPQVDDSCLAALGRAMVASERGETAEKHDALAHALEGYPDDPQVPAVREWLLGRLHSLGTGDRQSVAELMPLAISHCMDDWGRRIVRDLYQDIRLEWEVPSFMTGRSRFKEADPVSHAEAKMFFAFWTARPKLIERTVAGLVDGGLLRPHHLADAVFSLLELGLPEKASEVLDASEQRLPVPRGAKIQRSWSLAKLAVLAAGGQLAKAEEACRKVEFDPADRACNSARLWLARGHFAAGDGARALKALKALGPSDNFSREHQAWYCLLLGDAEGADKRLEPFIERGADRQGRNLSNFLRGTSLLMQDREDEAMLVFGRLKDVAWPRTWTLGSYYASGRLDGKALCEFLDGSFLWERKNLYSQAALLAAARGDEDEAVRCRELAAEVAGLDG